MSRRHSRRQNQVRRKTWRSRCSESAHVLRAQAKGSSRGLDFLLLALFFLQVNKQLLKTVEKPLF